MYKFCYLLIKELSVGHSIISNISKTRDKIEREFQNEILSVKKFRICTHMNLDTIFLLSFKIKKMYAFQ